MENCNSEMLNRALQNAGRRNGFEDIQAEFVAFRDFKLKWTRSYRWISFEVSDYLRNAPEDVMESLAETMFAKMRGEGKTEYSQEVCDYLNSDGFLKENQGIYLKRFRVSANRLVGRASTYWTAIGGSRRMEWSNTIQSWSSDGAASRTEQEGREVQCPDEDDRQEPGAGLRGHPGGGS